MKRSQFLFAGAGAMAACAVPSLSQRALAADALDVTLRSTPYTFAPFPGVSFAGLAYNGMLPGPVLRVTAGQRLRVRYENASGGPSTVHWHGMILPNAMDGVPNVTQAPVANGASFEYAFDPKPTGTRWYHDHVGDNVMRGLFGMIIVEDPRDERADQDIALVFHDVPKMKTVMEAMKGVSTAPMVDPMGSSEMMGMEPDDKMGDEVGYSAHCINGASYPNTKPIAVKIGQRVRLRILNANATQTRYVRLAGHRLRVTHADGNPLAQPLEVDALRIGVAERYDAWFEVTKPGAWLLQGISAAPLAFQQAVVVYTEGMEHATPLGSSQSLDGVDVFTYEKAGGIGANALSGSKIDVAQSYVLDGGKYGTDTWEMNGKVWPNIKKIAVHRGDRVRVHFTNKTDMDHPMHLHGHVFNIVEIDGKQLARPLAKDTSLVRANGGTMTWIFDATSPAGRWLLHCHNHIHMMDGMVTEVDYV